MLPMLEIGAWRLSSYTLLYVLAALASSTLAFYRLKRLPVPAVVLLRGVCLTTVVGFAGSYLVRVVPSIQHYLQHGAWEWIGGGSYIGGLLTGIGGLVLYSHWQRIPPARALDQVLPALPLGQAIGRLGCLAAGCCYGQVTDSWLALYLPDNRGDWAMRYPTQLLSAAASLLILASLLLVEKSLARRTGQGKSSRHTEHPSRIAARTENKGPSGPAVGLLSSLYVGLYCLERFLNELLRADAIPVLGPVSWAQLYAAVGVVISAALVVQRAVCGGSAAQIRKARLHRGRQSG